MEKQHILIVDDNPSHLLLLKRSLERLDLNVVQAASGKEALELLPQHDYALIILDVMMPGMDGFETAERIRKKGDTKHVPIIFATAISKDQKHIFKGYEAGAVDYLFKPINIKILESKVRVFLELHLHRQHLEKLVKERTGELSAVVESLRREIAERKLAEKRLKRSRKELRNLSGHLQTIREKERTRISREIHDDLGQILAILKMYLSRLKEKLPQDDKSLFENTKTMTELIDVCIKTVMRISEDLRPSLLDNLGLIPAMEWHVDEFQKSTGITCALTFDYFDVEEIALDKDCLTVIFRIFQEGLANVAHHSGAAKVKMNLRKKDEKLILTIKDNGRGITQEKLLSTKSLGIIGIRERARFLGGKVKIEGLGKKGTTVTVTIPFFKIKKL